MARATRPAVRQSLVLLVGVLVLVGTTVAGQGDVLMRFLEPPFWAARPNDEAPG